MEGQEGERKTSLTFPLSSRRLQLHHIQLIAKGLDLPTAASASDLSVMISGRLQESNHDPSYTQVVITQSEEGEELSLQDMGGVFLRIPVSKFTSSRTSPAATSEVSAELQDAAVLQENDGFSAEMQCLELVLSSMEQELVESRTQLREAQEEAICLRSGISEHKSKLLEAQRELELERKRVVDLVRENETLLQQSSTAELQSLKEEIKRGQDAIVELWHTNCQQLLTHDSEMIGKQREIKVLCDRLHRVEMELATLRLERLNAATHPTVSQSTCTNFAGSVTGGTSLNPLGPGGYNNKPTFTLPEWSGDPLTTTQSGVVITTLPLLQSDIHAEATAATNTQSKLWSDPRIVPSVQASRGQGHYGTSNQTDTASSPRMSLTVQPDGQVTNVSTSLTSAPFISRPINSAGTAATRTFTVTAAPGGNNQSQCRRGKAPPIDEFTGEDSRITFDDWLPILERAATWNGWTQDELLMQLAGYLRGRALQEWKLLDAKAKTTYHSTVKALRERLDPRNQTLAALDFRHASQKPSETVSDFLRRLEHIYQIAFGRDDLSAETRDMLLYGQLQEGLSYSLIESPSVSGAQSYRELCIAAKKEERRLVELKKKQQYLKAEKPPFESPTRKPFQKSSNSTTGNRAKPFMNLGPLRCFNCNSPRHLARDCRKPKTESQGKSSQKATQELKGAKMIRTRYDTSKQKQSSCVEVKVEGVPVTGLIDTGSDITIIRGDLFYHIVEVGKLENSMLEPADLKACTYDQKPITLDGRIDLHISFGERVICTTVYVKLVAPDQLLLSEAVCCQLGIVSYHPSVQSVSNHNMTTMPRPPTNTVNCKSALPKSGKEPPTSAPATFRSPTNTINIIDYKSDTSSKQVPKSTSTLQSEAEKQATRESQLTLQPRTTNNLEQPIVEVANDEENLKHKHLPNNSSQAPSDPAKDVIDVQEKLPQNNQDVMSQVRLIKAVRLPANYSATVPVQVTQIKGTVLLEPTESLDRSLQVEESLLNVKEDGSTAMVIRNNSSSSFQLNKGMALGQAMEATVVDHTWQESLQTQQSSDTVVSLPPGSAEIQQLPRVLNVSNVADTTDNSSEHVKWRQQQLGNLLESTNRRLSEEDHLLLKALLFEYHEVFSLEKDERGETDIIEFEINTGDEPPRKQAARRIPYAARQEVVDQLERMQRIGVIRPSNSPWSSPVVLVRKRDGTLRFCIDYRVLNSVTKPDVFPLPRINDLLDQLGKSKYYTTLDLASGYWQIKVNTNSQEKTAFATHQGLFEFRVMPFGVMNAPAVFQRLMQRVLSGLQFVSVYLDDVIVYSETLEEHVSHLRTVFERLRTANLKLNPAKCKFVCEEVDYLGHVITPVGLKPSERNLAAVREFPVPTKLKHLRQFLGLTSHYRRFIHNYAKLAHPLYALTRKGAQYLWTAECEVAFEALKSKLVTPPILAYPDFSKDFIIETDASKYGLGAILSQRQEDRRLHPVAYASRSVSASEANYAITNLETLAVVWAIAHFRYYVYGHNVTVITDHAAVKAVLGAPNLTGQHARWWSKVYGSGVGRIDIVHRAGKENRHADALSRQPVLPAPSEDDRSKEVQIAQISSDDAVNITTLLHEDQDDATNCSDTFHEEQLRDPKLHPIMVYLSEGFLPEDPQSAAKIIVESSLYTMADGILYYTGEKKDNIPKVVVPSQYQNKLMEEYHAGVMSGHFSGPKIYKAMSRQWWWNRMYQDIINYTRTCPQCAIATGVGRRQSPPMQSIPVDHPFQIVGVDIMELPLTTNGNRYAIVFQDLFTKWPMVYAAPDQKAVRIVKLLVEEIVPVFGVPEALLSDRGTNLLSCLMQDVCKLLGIKKLNTTAHHPQCNGMIERFNRTLKTMLRKHVSQFGMQWDTYLSGVLWAYRNTPHSSTGEKPSYLLFGFDCRHPTEAATLPAKSLNATIVTDYREQLVLNLSSARALAAKSISKAQQNQRAQYNQHTKPSKLKVGDWILIHFPQDETGKLRKLSRPWHGPYRIISRDDPDITAVKIFFPTDPPIQVHQSRVNKCPPSFPNDFYWYGGRKSKPGRPSKKIQKQLEAIDAELRQSSETIANGSDDHKDTTQSSEINETITNKEDNSREGQAKSDTTADVPPSSGQEARNDSQKGTSTTTGKLDQQRHECPYSLRSHHQKNDRTDNIQGNARDELNQRRK